jgi:ubiquinone biosynthesis protein
MQVQPQLILLQKTLFNIEGLGRQLYPELDLWKTAHPVLAQWMRERVRPATIFKEIRSHWPDALLALRQVPQAVQNALREANTPKSEPLSMPALREAAWRLAARRELLLGAALLWVSGLAWLALAAHHLWLGWSQMLAAIALFVRFRTKETE